MERASAADFALDPDASAHEFDQTRANGQPKPGAAIFSGGGAVSLRKRLENEFLLFFRNAAARVCDAPMHHDRFPGLRFQLCLHTYGTSVCELDRIANQIQQDLLEPQ